MSQSSVVEGVFVPDDALARMERDAFGELDNGNVKRARDLLEDVVAFGTSSPLALVAYSVCLLESGDGRATRVLADAMEVAAKNALSEGDRRLFTMLRDQAVHMIAAAIVEGRRPPIASLAPTPKLHAA